LKTEFKYYIGLDISVPECELIVAYSIAIHRRLREEPNWHLMLSVRPMLSNS